MRGFPSGRRRHVPTTRSAAVTVAGLILLTALVAPATLAAAPNPSPGSATVDGDTGDWSLSADFFADMTDGGKPDITVRAKLYLRYDCESETLFALVLAQGGEQARQDRPDEAYLRIDGSGKLISPTNGEFAWVNGDGTLADGWEGSGALEPGEYTVRAHVLIADDSADGYTPMDPIGRDVPLVIECEEPTEEPTPTPTPTPTPDGEVAPTQGTNPTPKPPANGAVDPTQQATLPPTDTLESTETAQPGGIGLALLLLGVTSIASLALVSSRRRRPVTATVKESIERR